MVHFRFEPLEMEKDHRLIAIEYNQILQADPSLEIAFLTLKAREIDRTKWIPMFSREETVLKREAFLEFKPRKGQTLVVNRYTSFSTLTSFSEAMGRAHEVDKESFYENELERRGFAEVKQVSLEASTLAIREIMDQFQSCDFDIHWFYRLSSILKFEKRQKGQKFQKPKVLRKQVEFPIDVIDVSAFEDSIVSQWTDEERETQGGFLEWLRAHDGKTMWHAIFGFETFDEGHYLRRNGNEVLFVGKIRRNTRDSERKEDVFYSICFGC